MVALDVGGAVLASIAVAVVKIPSVAKTTREKSNNILLEVKEGYKIIYDNKGLFSLLWIGVIFSFLYAPVNALFPLMSMNYFGGSALMQEKIAPQYLGRVFGLYGSLMSFAFLFGLLVTGILADIVGVNIWFFISGTIIFLLAISAFLMPDVRNIDKERYV